MRSRSSQGQGHSRSNFKCLTFYQQLVGGPSAERHSWNPMLFWRFCTKCLSLSLSPHLSVCLSVSVSVSLCLSVSVSLFCLFLFLCFCFSLSLSFSLFLSLSLSFTGSICLPLCVCVCEHVCLFLCLSLSLSSLSLSLSFLSLSLSLSLSLFKIIHITYFLSSDHNHSSLEIFYPFLFQFKAGHPSAIGKYNITVWKEPCDHSCCSLMQEPVANAILSGLKLLLISHDQPLCLYVGASGNSLPLYSSLSAGWHSDTQHTTLSRLTELLKK